MAKYKILVIAHCLKNNVVAGCNEIVDESQLTSPADELIDAGFIEIVDEENEDKVIAPKKKK